MEANVSQLADDEKKQNRALYDAFKTEVLKRDVSNSENYDKALLALITFTLGLSVSTINLFIPLLIAINRCCLMAAWWLLVASIAIMLIAYNISNKALSKQLKFARQYYIENIDGAFDQKNVWTKVNQILNIGAGIFYVVALCLILYFITTNVKAGNVTMTNKNETDLRKSLNIPTMEPKVKPSPGASVNIPTMEQKPSPPPPPPPAKSDKE